MKKTHKTWLTVGIAAYVTCLFIMNESAPSLFVGAAMGWGGTILYLSAKGRIVEKEETSG